MELTKKLVVWMRQMEGMNCKETSTRSMTAEIIEGGNGLHVLEELQTPILNSCHHLILGSSPFRRPEHQRTFDRILTENHRRPSTCSLFHIAVSWFEFFSRSHQ